MPGQAVHSAAGDFWFPPVSVPAGSGQERRPARLPVLTRVSGYSRWLSAVLRALVAIMSAEGNGTPLTAGQLREQLGLSSGGASLVIDRLEQAGHIRRARDHPADNRVVHLRYTDQGRATGLAFFGSLGDRTHAILDGFTEDELQVIARFITAMAGSARQHVQELEGRLPGVRPTIPPPSPRCSAETSR